MGAVCFLILIFSYFYGQKKNRQKIDTVLKYEKPLPVSLKFFKRLVLDPKLRLFLVILGAFQSVSDNILEKARRLLSQKENAVEKLTREFKF